MWYRANRTRPNHFVSKLSKYWVRLLRCTAATSPNIWMAAAACTRSFAQSSSISSLNLRAYFARFARFMSLMTQYRIVVIANSSHRNRARQALITAGGAAHVPRFWVTPGLVDPAAAGAPGVCCSCSPNYPARTTPASPLNEPRCVQPWIEWPTDG